MSAEVQVELEVCDDCAQILANGEINDGTKRGEVTMQAITRVWGDDAAHLVLACTGDEDDCTSFTWTRCEGCGSTLGGSRHRAALVT